MSAAERLPSPLPAPLPPTRARVVPFSHITQAEYFQRDAATTDGRLEYYDGEIVAMAGAQPAHIDLVGNLLIGLSQRLGGKGCRVRTNDQRVYIPTKRGYVYPDVVAACGEWHYQPDTNPAALLNPVLLIEVLSESTAANDQGRKFEWYQTLPSLRYYALVSAERVSVLLYSREPGARLWTAAFYEDLTDELPLTALNVALPLAEIYNAVVFGEGE